MSTGSLASHRVSTAGFFCCRNAGQSSKFSRGLLHWPPTFGDDHGRVADAGRKEKALGLSQWTGRANFPAAHRVSPGRLGGQVDTERLQPTNALATWLTDHGAIRARSRTGRRTHTPCGASGASAIAEKVRHVRGTASGAEGKRRGAKGRS